MATCNFCKAAFGSRQAVRAHLKGCAAYKAHRESEGSDDESEGKRSSGSLPVSGSLRNRQTSVPKAMPKDTEQQITAPTRGSRLDHEAVEMVLRTSEDFRALRQDLVESLPIRRLCDPVAVAKGLASYEEWEDLTKDVVTLERATDRIVTQARVSRDEPWSLYKLALAVRDRWLSWRRTEAHSYWQREGEASGKSLDDVLDEFGVADLEQRLTRVIEGLRWLTSHTRAIL